MSKQKVEEQAELRARIADLEARLRMSEARLQTVLNGFPFDLWVVDKDKRYVLQSAGSIERFGSVIGKTPREVAPSLDVALVWEETLRRAFAGEVVSNEIEYVYGADVRQHLNVVGPVIDGGEVRGALGVSLDITDTKRLREEVERSQRLESVGALAGGIAHDFNNLLMAILGNIAVARRDGSLGPRALSLLDEAQLACFEARTLTKQLLTFARGGEPVRRVTSVSEVLHEATANALRGSPCTSRFTVAENLWHANADADQLHHVLRNLVVNAHQAMPQGGVVDVTAENESLGPKNPIQLPAGDYLRITVIDTGSGISDACLPRIYDPYFTTKEQGRGLGLAVVYSILRKHGGAIRAESKHGDGTAMVVYLPAVSAQPSITPSSGAIRNNAGAGGGDNNGAGPPAPTESLVGPRNDGERPRRMRVLVIDDDARVRDATAEMLRVLAWEPVCVGTCDAAVLEYGRAMADSARFAAVIVDLTMRGGTRGTACLAQLRECDPAVRAIVASGYSDDAAMAQPERHGFIAVLRKPYTLSELNLALRQATVAVVATPDPTM